MSSLSLQLISRQALEAITSHAAALFVGLPDHLSDVNVDPGISVIAELLEERPILRVEMAEETPGYLHIVGAHRVARRFLREDEFALDRRPGLRLHDRDDHACLILHSHCLPSLCTGHLGPCSTISAGPPCVTSSKVGMMTSLTPIGAASRLQMRRIGGPVREMNAAGCSTTMVLIAAGLMRQRSAVNAFDPQSALYVSRQPVAIGHHSPVSSK